jgi:hypothetical protein
VSIRVEYSEREGERYTVRISRPNGQSVWGTYVVDQVKFTSGGDDSAWGARHVDAWRRAWRVFRLSPQFPRELHAWELDLTQEGIPTGVKLEYATVNVREGARVNAQDLYECVRIADSVLVHGSNGSYCRLVAQD